MKPDSPQTPPNHPESRLTALLLGELSPEESADLRLAMRQDADLARLYERLKLTIGLVREVSTQPEDATGSQPTPLRLSEDRRQKLLAQFRTITLPSAVSPPPPQRKKGLPWPLPLGIAAALMAMLFGLSQPGLYRMAKSSTPLAATSPTLALHSESLKDEVSSWFDFSRSANHAMVVETKPAVNPAKTPSAREEKQWGLTTNSVVVGGRIAGGDFGGGSGGGFGGFGGNGRIAEDARKIAAKTEPESQIRFDRSGRANAAGTVENRDEWSRQLKTAAPAPVARNRASGARSSGNLGDDVNVQQENEALYSQLPAAAVAGRPFASSSSTAARGGGRGAGPAAPATPKPGSPSLLQPVAKPSATPPSSPTASQPVSRGIATQSPESALGRRSLALLDQDANGIVKGQFQNQIASDFAESDKMGESRRKPRATATANAPAPDASGYQLGYYYQTSPPADREKVQDAKKAVKGITERYEDLGQKAQTPSRRLSEAEGTIQTMNGSKDIPTSGSVSGPATPILGDTPILGVKLKETAGKYALADGKELAQTVDKLERIDKGAALADVPAIQAGLQTDWDGAIKTPAPAAEPQPEIQTADNPFSTFSLNIADVSFKLAAASLENGVRPDPASIRSEEFINAFNYRDPAPAPGSPIGFAWDRARYPFAHNREVVRFALQTAARGREANRPLNLVLLLDNSGSMERADRVSIIHEALKVLAGQLLPQDQISVVTFARTARLWIDGLPGNRAQEMVDQVGNLNPEGGTNLEDALNLAYQTALRHFLATGVNRVVLLTDGAANLGNVNPSELQQKVEQHRKQGIALDCFGIGWEGYNDDLLEVLARHGDGRYGFVNSTEDVPSEFASQLAGALQVAAVDVKVQVEFNPARVTAYRQIGYAKHQLTKEQFRDNTVDAAEIGAAEAGNALYLVEVNPRGAGPLATLRVRYKVPATGGYRECEWTVSAESPSPALDQAGPALRLATVSAAFAEWLANSPYAGDITPDRLLGLLNGVPAAFAPDSRPQKLEWMVRQAKSIGGR